MGYAESFGRVFILDGVLEDDNGRYGKGTWLRSPHGSRHRVFSREGVLLYVKAGHLMRS